MNIENYEYQFGTRRAKIVQSFQGAQARLSRAMRRQKPLCVCYLLVITLSGVVNAAQYNTSAASSWIQLEAEDTFSGRNGESPTNIPIMHGNIRTTISLCLRLKVSYISVPIGIPERIIRTRRARVTYDEYPVPRVMYAK